MLFESAVGADGALGEKKYMGVATYQEGDFQDVLDSIASGEFFLSAGVRVTPGECTDVVQRK